MTTKNPDTVERRKELVRLWEIHMRIREHLPLSKIVDIIDDLWKEPKNSDDLIEKAIQRI